MVKTVLKRIPDPAQAEAVGAFASPEADAAVALPLQEEAAVPRHIAIIMDGNGRWALQRGQPRQEGHRAGVETLRRVVEWVAERGVQYLTVYSFSSENWSRPPREVAALLQLMKHFVTRDLADLKRRGVRVRIIGNRANLSSDLLDIIGRVERETAENDKFYLNVAFNYGARDEILRAARAAAKDAAAGRLDPSALDETAFSKYLDTADAPEPDLLIRTSGEQRLSNFLLWQCAYTEFVFVPAYWPDFSETVLDEAMNEYRGRKRRFGGLHNREV